MADFTPADLGSLLASIAPITRHYRLETAKRGERMIYHFALWTNTGRRVSAYGPTPMGAIEAALADLHAGRTKPNDARHRPRVLTSAGGIASMRAMLRLVEEEANRG